MLRTLTGAGAILSAAHTGPDGRLHGHTWEIIAWWTGEPCAVEMQGRLTAWVGKFDHGVLPPNMSRGEAIATQCLVSLDCERVEINRPGERVYAVVERPQQTERTAG